MAKELPYFKFEPSEWENGNIQMCEDTTKLHFLNMCCIYWLRLGDLSEKLAIIKCCKGDSQSFKDMVEAGIIKVKAGAVSISFLDKQLSEFIIAKKTNAASGKKGGTKGAVRPGIERVKGNQMYGIICKGNGEEFLKIGTTSNCISRRYSGKMPYEYHVAFQVLTDSYLILEEECCELFANCEYTPRLSFPGQKECYHLTNYQAIIDHIKRFAQAALKRNEAIRVEEIRLDKIKEDTSLEKKQSDFSTSNEDLEASKKNNAKNGQAQKKAPRAKFEPDLSVLEDEASRELIQTFLDYRRAKGKPYKTQQGVTGLINELRSLAGGSFQTAKAIIEQSIAHEWDGIFKLKSTKNGTKVERTHEEHANHVLDIAEQVIRERQSR